MVLVVSCEFVGKACLRCGFGQGVSVLCSTGEWQFSSEESELTCEVYEAYVGDANPARTVPLLTYNIMFIRVVDEHDRSVYTTYMGR
jgi:hypothetical protein